MLNANEVVSRDRLIDELWGANPPETAVQTVQVYVSRLRKILPAGTLVTQAPGYVLRVEPEQLDVRRFERLAGEGRYHDALALWRGPPLAEFVYEPFAQTEIARLEELRLAAIEERIEVDLAHGRHGELVGEVERLVALHPLRERLRGHLMLALYRSGRQAEALEAYQAARHALVDELGLEPGAALQQLEKAILTQEPALNVAPRRPPVEAPTSEEPSRPERKLATVLFAALVDPTTLGAAKDPERRRETLERFYEAMEDEVSVAGGTVETFVGDALMAVFGIPVAHEDDAERALHAALAMRRKVEAVFGQSLSLRIGVNSGEVVVGRARERSAIVTGDALTVAASLEQAAEPGEILVGDRTAALAGGAFEFDEPTTVAARGGDSGVRARRLLRALALLRPRGRLQRSPFVGRDVELAALKQAFERVVSSGEPQLVTVVGDAGVGKSRLAREFWEWLEASADAARRIGRCLPYGRGVTYRPIGDILREHFRIGDDDPPESVRSALGDREILALALGLDMARDIHPLEARERLHDAWVELLEDAAGQRPLVLLFEDLHWAEEPLLELLERVVLETRGPVLLLCNARPELVERSSTWGRARAAGEWVWLDPLSAEDSDLLVAELLGAEPTPEIRQALSRAEGNPFFLEELLHVLPDYAELAAVEIPDSVQAVIAARIDLLPPTEKAALQAGAVIGRAFRPASVRDVLAGTNPDFGVLESRDFVRRSRRPANDEREFVFKHALTREVTYASLTRGDRARLHAAFAGWLEAHGSGRDEDAPVLARHYAAAVRPDDADLAWGGEAERHAELRVNAVTWLGRAAELAIGRYELADARALIDEALALEDGRQARVELLRSIAEVERMRFEMSGFRDALERALELEPSSDVAAAIYAELAASGAEPYLWKDAPGDEDVARWTRSALELAETGSRARGQALTAAALADPEEGSAAADEAVLIGERLDDRRLLAIACFAQTRIATLTRDFRALSDWSDRKLAVARSVGDPDHRTNQYFSIAIDYLKLGRLVDARQVVEDHDAWAAPLSPHHKVHTVSLHLIQETVAGRWDAAAARGAEAERTAEANLDTPCQFNWRSLALAALASAHAGDEREARRLEERARQLEARGGPGGHEPAFIRLALLRDDLDGVARLLEGAPVEGSFWDVDTPAARLDALSALGYRERIEAEAAPWLEIPGYTRPFALRALGVVRGERALVEEAVAHFEAIGLGFRAEETRALAAG